jgi:hypothetical protein
MNLKKIPGTNEADHAKIAHCAREDRALLLEQMSILHPDVVVCCGRDLVFSLAKQIFPDAQQAECVISRSRTSQRLPGRVFQGGATWIDFVHPGIWGKGITSAVKYDSLIDLLAAQ